MNEHTLYLYTSLLWRITIITTISNYKILIELIALPLKLTSLVPATE